MFNISDILKKYKDSKNKPEEVKESNPGEGLEPRPAPVEAIDKVCILPALSREMDSQQVAIAGELYCDSIKLVQKIYQTAINGKSDILSMVNTQVEKIIDQLKRNNEEVLQLCLQDYADIENFMPAHIVNVSIFSLEIGLGVVLGNSALKELGAAAFLHDIGWTKYADLMNKKETLNKDEYKKLRNHPEEGSVILEKIVPAVSKNIIDAVRQEHERADGSGYPHGLKLADISEYAQIIGLADVYEAMMHSRPDRKRLTALETIKTILNNKSEFEYSKIKALIERVGIFPACSLVRLNTKEIAMVIKDNPKLPLRPKVKILIDGAGKKLSEPKELDLAENTVIYIEESIQ